MSLLRVRGLGKSFGGVHAVDGIDFDLGAGELLAFIGPNGAGKSTTFNMINGQLHADRGSVDLDGKNLLGLSPRAISRLGVARTFQIAQTFASLTVLENVQMSVLSHHRQIFSFWMRATQSHLEESMSLLEQVGLLDQADKPTSALAYGDIKRLELAMALAGRPRLLLMDEPTAGMGSSERHALMSLTKSLVTEKRIAVLFTEHSMDVVFAFADRVLVLARGRLIADGSAEQVRDDPKVQQVYLGSGALSGSRVGDLVAKPDPSRTVITAPAIATATTTATMTTTATITAATHSTRKVDV